MSRQHEEEAIVLDCRLSGESDRRVLLLASSGELVRGVAPSAARSRRRFGGALQPGTRVRARWSVKRPGADAVLEEAQVVAAPPPGEPLERLYAAAHLLELGAGFAREGAEDERLFRLVAACLDALASGAPVEELLRYAEAWTLRLAGLLGDLARCDACGAALEGRTVRIVPEGGACCPRHATPGALSLGPAAGRWLSGAWRQHPTALDPLPAVTARELAAVLPALLVAFTGRPLVAWPALERLRRDRPSSLPCAPHISLPEDPA